MKGGEALIGILQKSETQPVVSASRFLFPDTPHDVKTY